MAALPHLHPIRHLSPAAAHTLLERLEQLNPDCLLLEAPADAAILADLARPDVTPPVALLAYTVNLPVATVLYPFAAYSPEFQAILWAKRTGRELRLIDLPTDILLALQNLEAQPRQEEEDETRAEAEDEPAAELDRHRQDLYERLTAAFHAGDYESFWESAFEHNLLPCDAPGSYPDLLRRQSGDMRRLLEEKEAAATPRQFAHNQIREAHMRRSLQAAAADGFRPERTLAVVGAYHLAGLAPELPPLTDAELDRLPRAPSRLTLMPYSYHRLSSRVGYGAGNRAPLYFELLWQARLAGALGQAAARYLAEVGRIYRDKGGLASTAAIIEGVRLAEALASMRDGGGRPVLRDLHDAAVSCFAGGERGALAETLTLADIGLGMGSLPEGVSRTPVQEDLDRELKRLKLSSYRTPAQQDLTLDLRENFKVKSGDAAFLDLNRSTFLHRLAVLGITFAQKLAVNQEAASWREGWRCQWTPETEIQAVEANLKGETVEVAAAYQLTEQLAECSGVASAARVIRQACECGLAATFASGLGQLQATLVEAADIRETAAAARELSLLLAFGDVRRFDLRGLEPILRQLFLRGTLLLLDATVCDDAAAGEILNAMNQLENVAREQHALVDVEAWRREVGHVAEMDDRNPRLSGAAFALILEHDLVNEEECARELRRRMSPGVPAALGADWFEGLASRNRFALVSRVGLWRDLDAYVRSMDDLDFRRAVVPLRRALSTFDAGRKNAIAELLGEFWGGGGERTAEALRAEPTQEEKAFLEELNDFEFDL